MTSRQSLKVRARALHILERVEHAGAHANVLLQNAYKDAEFDAGSHAFLTQLVKGTLEQQGTIDKVLAPLLHRGLDSLDPMTRSLLRLGAYQVLFLDKVPREVSVNESVELAKRGKSQSKAGLINAVLRKVVHAEKPQEDLSHPEWILNLWSRQLGPDEAAAIARANNEVWPTCLRCNTIKIRPEALRERLATEGLSTDGGKFVPDALRIVKRERKLRLHDLPSLKEGLCMVQDESASVVSHLVAPAEGDLIIDLCAAPGGKTAHMAALLENRGTIVAADPHPRRLALLMRLCRDLGADCVLPVAADGRSLGLSRLADRVLIDAPCSGLGVLGNKKDVRWKQKEEHIPGLVTLQRELLSHAAALLRPGGRIVYSTCTINTSENQEVVDWFLATHPDFARIPAHTVLASIPIDADGNYQSFPHRHGVAGAFAAILQKAR